MTVKGCQRTVLTVRDVFMGLTYEHLDIARFYEDRYIAVG